MKKTSMDKVLAIVQARMGSTRLPGKALLDIAGTPMLFRVTDRLAYSRMIDEILVATTTSELDDELVYKCEARGVATFRGSESDVLDRYYQAATSYRAKVVVRITSDCPMIDPSIVDRVIVKFMENEGSVDYVSNVIQPRTFPRGLDTEVFSYSALARAWNESDGPSFREHVTQYFLRNPGGFRLIGVFNDVDLSNLRWTVDTQNDLDFVRAVYSHFGDDAFTWMDVLSFLSEKPGLTAINKNVKQKPVP